ncbi:MAG: monofunctional biosynthetic peptidoglycan transglycosylase [Hyphomicrobiaceae bacterium]
MANAASRCAGEAIIKGSKWLCVAFVGFVGLTASILATVRFADPPMSAVMAWHWLSGKAVHQTWVPIEKISPNLIRAVVASEDARFCRHGGIDFAALQSAYRKARKLNSLSVRGASTISMQVVKNLFLWQDRSLLRKGLELAITPLMEALWPKRRILELYLNIAEWGPGVFGAEAAARHHFARASGRLSRAQAALLAASLPNPKVRRAGRPGPLTRRNAQRVRARAAQIDDMLKCLGPLGRLGRTS